jgi:hypothetical protein
LKEIENKRRLKGRRSRQATTTTFGHERWSLFAIAAVLDWAFVTRVRDVAASGGN